MNQGLRQGAMNIQGNHIATAVEPYFWAQLTEIAEREQTSLQQLLDEINQHRGARDRVSAIRLFVTAYFQAAASYADDQSNKTSATPNDRRVTCRLPELTSDTA